MSDADHINMLSPGQAAKAARLRAGRTKQIDDAVDKATGNAPAASPAPAPAAMSQADFSGYKRSEDPKNSAKLQQMLRKHQRAEY